MNKLDLEKQAIDILRNFSSNEPYQLGYSGGKDSDVILHLAKKSGVNFIAVHNHTTVDAPETVYYVRKKVMSGEVIVEYPKESMWQLIVRHKTPPTRKMRYCCADLKEYSGIGKKVVTGVRKYESRNRSENQGIVTFTRPTKEIKGYVDGTKKAKGIINGQITIDGTVESDGNTNFHLTNKGVVVLNYENSDTHRMVENCYRTSKTLVNPILEWDDEYLWWYIRNQEIEINPMYKNGCKEGCSRIGCIGCPMSGKGREKEFAVYPQYKKLYLNAFERMLDYRKQCGNKDVIGWKNAQGVFDWWMEDKNVEGQMSFEDLDWALND